jgi:hypothetical protein
VLSGKQYEEQVLRGKAYVQYEEQVLSVVTDVS